MPTTYSTGLDTWTYGEDARSAYQYLGPCPECGRITYSYGGNWACVNFLCKHSAERLVVRNEPRPEWWLKGIKVCLDGDTWMATGPDFVDLQESPAGFGQTPREAVANLLG